MKNKIYVLMVILAGAFWGSSCLFVNKLTNDIGFTSIQSTAVRVFFAALILNAAVIIKGRGFRLYRLSLGSYAIAACSGIFSVLSMCLFYYSCMNETSAAVAVILLYTAPIFVMVMSLIFFKERLTAKKIIAFLVAIVGCALVSGIASGTKISVWGILSGVLSGFSYSLYGIFTSFYMKKNDEPLTFSALNFLFAAMVAVAIASPAQIVEKTAGREYPWLTLLFFALFSLCTAVIPYVLYTVGLSGVKPDTASILAFTEPLTACIFGTLVLKQPMDVFGVIGILLVCAAIVILNVNFGKRKMGEDASL
ncbi:MAG: EamA family transporter [Clostridia bacterium]|nr:EamA family transporter [Clostridia bacterium]